LTKDELITSIIKNCKDANLSKRLAGDVLDAAFESISKSIKKDKRFAYPGFGTFTVRNRKARKGRNPQTGDQFAGFSSVCQSGGTGATLENPEEHG